VTKDNQNEDKDTSIQAHGNPKVAGIIAPGQVVAGSAGRIAVVVGSSVVAAATAAVRTGTVGGVVVPSKQPSVEY
jgi:hypothetical protein